MTVLTIAACACGSSPRGSELSVLAVGTDPIALYVVNDDKVEEQRSGIAPAWSPDGRHLAYGGDYDGNVWVDDRSYPVGDIASLEWTPDRRFLLYERGGIRLLDTATGTEELVAPGTWPALSPNGHTVAYLRYKRKKGTTDPIASTLQVVELAGGEPRVLARTTGPPFGPHFRVTPSVVRRRKRRRRRAADHPGGHVGVERVGLDGTREDIVPEIGEEFALSPDGRLIAYQLTEYHVALGVAAVGTSGNVYQLDKLVPKASLGLRNFGGLTWSPDGQEIAFYLSCGSGEIMRVYALEATTGETRRLAEIEQAAYADPAWKPDP
jgi:Tol biopolymer transport system component